MVDDEKDICYVPILKWRAGEKQALRNVESKYRKNILPLLELVNDEGDTPSDLTRDIENYWPYLSSGAAYVDVCYRPQRNALMALENLARFNSGVDIIPVVHLDTPPIYYNGIQQVTFAHKNGVAVRLSINDDSDFEIINEEIDLLMTTLKTEKKTSDLIIDFGYFSPLMKYEKIVKKLVEFVPLTEWRRVVVAGGVFPESLIDFQTDEDNFLQRREWTLWNNVKELLGRESIYGDYTCRHPIYHNKIPSLPSISLRYTLKDKFQVFRGTKQDAQFKYLVHSMNAVALYGSDYSSTYSDGDNYIHKQAADLERVLADSMDPEEYPDFNPGNPGNWVAATVSHHIAVVLKDNLSV